MPASIKGYLDTCTVSGLAKGDLGESTIDALLHLLRCRRSGQVDLLTSAVTKEEIDRIPRQHRTPHEAIYTLLEEIPIAQTHRVDSGLSLLGVGGGTREDPLFTELKSILPDEDDARHVFQAVKNGVSYFVTTDNRSILKFREAIKRCCSIEAVSPEELAALLEATRSA